MSYTSRDEARPTHTTRLGERCRDAGVDVVVTTSYENLLYLTGIESVALDMFPHTGSVFALWSRTEPNNVQLVSSRCEVDQALDAPWVSDAWSHGEFYREGTPTTDWEHRLARAQNSTDQSTTATTALISAITNTGDGRKLVIGVDETRLTPTLLNDLRTALPHHTFVHAADLLRHVRQVKTATEIHRLSRAAWVAEQGIQAALAEVKAGATEERLVQALEAEMARHGGRARFSLIKFGARAVGGQTRPTSDPITRGEHIWFDIGVVVNGYWADIARTACWGEPSPQLAAYYAAMRAGEDAALAAACQGMTGADLFDVTMQATREAGVPHYRRNHVGHGIGVEVYDRVLIRPDSTDVITDGTVVNIETPYYEFGLGAVHIEDPFVVREEGNELLTTLTRELIIVD